MKSMTSVLWVLLLLTSFTAHSEDRLRLATTTSTQNSGLMDVLNPIFEADYNVKVDIIAVGTGMALRLGQNGDVDAVLVHAPNAEIKFIMEGYGVERLSVMHNDFVLLGPKTDILKLEEAENIHDALLRIATSQSDFISRGDDSGTHKKENALWKAAGVTPKGKWYIPTGQGMGAVLTMANDKLAYTLSDRGTFLARKDHIDLVIVYEGDEQLYNPYHIILVNPERHPHVKTELAQAYADFIRSEKGQKIIRDFTIAGKQLFYPDVVP